jgi:ATP-dependent DNA helicase RecG
MNKDKYLSIVANGESFFNPGKLYGDMTIEKLSTDNYQAQTRNKLIAEAFYLAGEIKKYGSGYIRIREEMLSYPTMKLDFEEMGNGYLVILSYKVQKTTQKTTKGQILELLHSDNKMTRDDLASQIGVSSSAIKQHLSKLQSEGLLSRIGGRKDGWWQVNDGEKE